jgi:L-lactate dehydrogenase (cytochrome)
MSARGLHTVEDARRLARRRLPRLVFDYIDGAAGGGLAVERNRYALDSLVLQPRILRDVESRSTASEVFGKETGLAFGISPMGLCNLAWPGADAMLAQHAATHATPLGVSTASSTSLEKLIELAEGHAWFQLYFSGDETGSMRLAERARDAGYDTLVLTVDVPEVGRRPRELRRGFTMPFRIGPQQFVDFALHPRWSLTTLASGRPELANFGGEHGEFDRTRSRAGADWNLLQRLREHWKGRMVVKGVLDVDDAEQLRAAGIDAIQVSSHGGRQLESAPAPILQLARMRAALGPDYPLFYDSGIRSGEDIVKAYAAGADFVFLGRPLLFAIAAAQQAGLQELSDVLTTETSITLAQLGLTALREINQASLHSPPAGSLPGAPAGAVPANGRSSRSAA